MKPEAVVTLPNNWLTYARPCPGMRVIRITRGKPHYSSPRVWDFLRAVHVIDRWGGRDKTPKVVYDEPDTPTEGVG